MSSPFRLAAPLLIAVVQTACSIVSPAPLWELTKSVGVFASEAIPYGSSEASNTVYHLHPAFSSVCIEFNRDTPVADIIPALQIELQRHQIESRVYEVTNVLDTCAVWLRYTAYVSWDVLPRSGEYRPYVETASLSLQSPTGVVLSSSDYHLGTAFGMGKWSTTQDKLAPVVSALLTGFQN